MELTAINGFSSEARGQQAAVNDERLLRAEEELRQMQHKVRSSNLYFHEAVWNVATYQCKAVVAVSQRITYYESRSRDENGRPLPLRFRSAQRIALNEQTSTTTTHNYAVPESKEELTKKAVVIDIACENGDEWVKVSTATSDKLILDFARLGLELADLEANESEENGHHDDSGLERGEEEEDDDEVELIKFAKNATRAASTITVNYKHPRIRVKIPNIEEGKTAEIDWILKKIRKTGAIVECGNADTKTNDATPDSQSWEERASRMLPNPYPCVTDTVNIDCSVLIALVSQISNRRLEGEGVQRMIRQQIETEQSREVLATRLWPVCGSRELVCTFEAKKRLLEIVGILGMDEEKERTKLLLPEDHTDENEKPSTREDRLRRYQELCDHRLPRDWQIPIQIIDGNATVDDALATGKLPSLAHTVAEQLSDLNRSIFMTGWLLGITTITSNRTTVRQIEAIIENEKGDKDDDVVGPMTWICDTSRSLFVKDSNKDRKNRSNKLLDT